jgi:hypothetical protein
MAMDGAPEASFVLYPQLTPVQDRAFQLLDLGVQSVASPATREFEMRQADQWFALWTGGNLGPRPDSNSSHR